MGLVTAADPERLTSVAVSAQAHAQAPEEKRRFIHRLFSTIAPRYDWFNRLASLGLDQQWRARTIAAARLGPRMRILDVCTGTGDLALLCHAATRGRSQIVALDFNEPMLRGARHKSPSREAIAWLQGDALTLPFRSGSFDRVFIGFSTRNLSDLRGGLGEMIRVLKPQGEVLILETGRPANPLIRVAHWAFLWTVAPVIGWLLTGRLWPFTYLARSVRRFVSPQGVVALLRSCGTQARYVPLSRGLASLYLARKPEPAGAGDKG